MRMVRGHQLTCIDYVHVSTCFIGLLITGSGDRLWAKKLPMDGKWKMITQQLECLVFSPSLY